MMTAAMDEAKKADKMPLVIAVTVLTSMDEKTMEEYPDLGEWGGAAGSYRIQERGKELVEAVRGDIATVIGLPLMQISEILACDCARL